MPKNIVQYDLLISCPGDITDEIQIIDDAVAQFNTQFSDALGISIRTKHWRKNSYAQSGGKPQELLNEQFVNDCDAAVAILWTRFGTPTDEYGSGTEEEVEIMRSSGKQVFMYFSDKSIPPSQLNSDEYRRVLAFREKYKDEGIYFSYSSNDEFKSLFFAHLSLHFLSEKKVAEINGERHSILKLVGIDRHQHINDVVQIIDFVPNVKITMAQYIEKIHRLFKEISEMRLEKRTELPGAWPTLNFSFNKPVEIDKDDREIICSVARYLSIEISEDFFNLGDLSKSTLSTSVLGGSSLIGTDEEKRKYRTIGVLRDTFSKCLEWEPIEKAFSDKKCIKLALQNCGTDVDEDIELSLKIPKECLLPLSEFPKFSNDEMEYLLRYCDMGEMFGICSTSEYSDYSNSITNRHFSPHISNYPTLPGYTPDYSDDFIRNLESTFCYSCFEEKGNFILKLKIDYIKHNTVVAFPSVIFIKKPFTSISYTITSKNCSEITSGEIIVTEETPNE